MRPTLTDVARVAGVSSATVDRVLNGRAGVRARTRDRVLAAARQLDYVEAPADRPAADRIPVDLLLPAGSNSFMQQLGAELVTQARSRGDLLARLHLVEGFNPDTLAQSLRALAGQTRGIAVIGIDHPAVRVSLRQLVETGVPVLTLVSDIQNVPRLGYVGINNRSAGRLAGYLLHRFLGPGRHKLALLAGSIAYRGHEEREMGFRHIVSEHPDHMDVVAFSEIRDDDARAYEATRQHLAHHPDLAAIYNIGAGNGGIARALEEAGAAGRVVFVGHDLTPQTRRLLLDGTMDAVIDQNPRVEARETLEQLARAAKGLGWSAHPLRTQIILRENLPDESSPTPDEPA